MVAKRKLNTAVNKSFVRFVLTTRHPESGVEEGLFRAAYRLRDSSRVEEEDRRLLTEVLAWFGKNLVTPDRFNRSKSKGFYRRTTRGIAWFRNSATDCLSRMHRMRVILEKYGHPVTMLTETRVGYVVYEDELQVVAEPFSDTQTR
ncbi:MAG: hypothetical protein K0S99_1447 [Thermomicrobiales bacterium]|nr:hypothetical protein [Thermomicrobiales bacterium]